MKRGLSFSFVLRNLMARRLTTFLTAGGMALVVFVFACVLMMSEGLRQTMAGTGSYDNVVILRKGTSSEVQSSITRGQANIIASLPGLASDQAGNPAVSPEVMVLVNLPRKDGEGMANIVVRGTSAQGLALRPQVRVVQGRLFKPGSSEIMVGEGLTRGRLALRVGDAIPFGLREWRIVGVFAAGTSGFDSEIWGDSPQMMQAFRRSVYSSMIVGLRDSASYEHFTETLQRQADMKVDFRRESLFYADQSEQMTGFIEILGKTITVIFSIGAIIGAMITMYSSVANRTREIGTLRALGFHRGNILGIFLQEAMLLGAIAALIGLAAAACTQFADISTTNIQTFSEVTFRLIMTPAIILQVLLFSVLMGILGGVLPAFRAARLEIVDALRSV